jgi:hypothetical protein
MSHVIQSCRLAVLLLAVLGAIPARAQAPAPAETTKERVAALKQSLAQSQKALRAYQWVETTTVSMKGEVKSQKQATCFYGADGALQKTPIGAAPPPQQKKRGLKAKVVESKKEEISNTVKQAVALVKSYVPPDAALIQKAVDAGKVSVENVQPGKIVRLVIKDYRLPGDVLGITLDATNNHLAGLDVATYLGKPSSPVDLKVSMGTLTDGTTYAATTQLTVESEKLAVNIANAGYRPTK